jgi:Xaa-Pro aminopeptidase
VNDRVARLRAQLEEPLLVTNPTNVRYLIGFASSNAALVVEPDRVRLFTDFRYAERARAVEGVELTQTSRALVRDLAAALEGRVGFEADHVTYAAWETLRAGRAELVPRRGLVEVLRAVKDESELATIREAAAITTRAYERLAEEPFVGRTERELAWQMELVLREEGAEEMAFAVMVLAGANAARPHATPGDGEVGRGETVIVDAGARLRGYSSDCTRTFATGSLPDRLREAYAVCLDAQLQALRRVRAGANGREVDAFARSIVDASPYRGTFGHGLGHGLGLETHESPGLRQEEEHVLRPGNVVTVEPGIYLEGEGGIRIEDLVVVTDGEPEVLTPFSKALREVD